MTDDQIAHVEHLLLGRCQARQGTDRPVRVYEWGSGGSTYHFASLLQHAEVPYTWWSVEYNKRWWECVYEATRHLSGVSVRLHDVGNDRLKQRRTDMDAYVDDIFEYREYGTKFDLVLVDGRKRRRCLLNASQVLAPGGVVVLHDASRKYYHCAFDAYKSGLFLDPDLWVGRMDS